MAAPGREWYPPADGATASSLRLYNSLLDANVPFVPAAGPDSRQISWYACGPTVYDSAHMGHARNYVTFDVIRRVLEDYFGYNVQYVMNVTDVDDKIILRARRNHLLQQYRLETTDAAQVAAFAQQAVEAAVGKQSTKVAATEQQATTATGSRQRTELEGAVKNEQHKLKQVQEVAAKLQQLLAGGAPAGADAVLAVAGDAVAEALDAAKGSQVSDQAIFRAHAAKYEREFFEDLDALGVRRPDVLTRVCEYVPEIIAYVQRIIGNGMAYEANGSVYFDTRGFREAGHVYGKCKPSSVGNAALASESEANFDTREKRSASDFALWKAAKPGEPSWDSPWGRGRPGWHIECSAMASSLIGANMDLHTGGEDLKFPHHDNELAQAEAHFHTEGCRQWVNYFLHSGHLEIEGLKMSKSLKNFITIREALQSFTPRQLRLMFLLAPWGRTMNYGEAARTEMRAKESALRNFFANVDVAVREAGTNTDADAHWHAEEGTLNAAILEGQARVHEALCDNIATNVALDALFGIVKAVNVYLAAKQQQQQQPAAASTSGNGVAQPPASAGIGCRVQPLLLQKAAAYVTRILSVFGLVPAPADAPGLGGSAEAGRGAAASEAGARYLDILSAFRDEVRALVRAKAAPGELLAACDRLRDGALVEAGVRLEDRPDGRAAWKLDDPAAMRAEQAERAAAAAEASRKKLEGALERKERELAKFQALAALPSLQEALADKYSAWDAASGEPTHDKEGAPLEDKARAKAQKEVDKQRKVRDPLTKKLAEDPGFMGAMQAEVEQLRQQLAGLGVAAGSSSSETAAS